MRIPPASTWLSPRFARCRITSRGGRVRSRSAVSQPDGVFGLADLTDSWVCAKEGITCRSAWTHGRGDVGYAPRSRRGSGWR